MAKSKKPRRTVAAGPDDIVMVNPVGAAEAAEILGVDSYYIHRFRKQGRLEDPVVTLACGTLWEKQTILDLKPEVERTRALRHKNKDS